MYSEEEKTQMYRKLIRERISDEKKLSELKVRADDGDVDAMFECFKLSIILEAQDNFEVQDNFGRISANGETFKWLKKAAMSGHVLSVKLLTYVYLTGELSDMNVKINIEPNPQLALETCNYFKEEDLDKEDVKRFVELINNVVEKLKTNNSPSNSSEGCYIATAVYGDYDAPQVLVLRRFRDKILLHHWWGKLFVKFYYFVSPPLADKLKNTTVVNKKVKQLLDYFVRKLINKNI